MIISLFGIKFTLQDYLTRTIWNISSLSENKVKKLYPQYKHELIRHNEKFMSRHYPGNLRVDSSNYDIRSSFNIGA